MNILAGNINGAKMLRTLFMRSPETGKRLKLVEVKEAVNSHEFELIMKNKNETWKHTIKTEEV